jgi:hypothetical protein
MHDPMGMHGGEHMHGGFGGPWQSSGDGGHSPMRVPLIPAPVAFMTLMFGLMIGMMIGRKKAAVRGMGGAGMCGGQGMGMGMGHMGHMGMGGWGGEPGWDRWAMKKKMMMGGMPHHHHGDGTPPCGCGAGEKDMGSSEE